MAGYMRSENQEEGYVWMCCKEKMTKKPAGPYTTDYKCEICGCRFSEARIPFHYLEPIERMEQ